MVKVRIYNGAEQLSDEEVRILIEPIFLHLSSIKKGSMLSPKIVKSIFNLIFKRPGWVGYKVFCKLKQGKVITTVLLNTVPFLIFEIPKFAENLYACLSTVEISRGGLLK